MKFWKMNGAGNDFIVINNIEEKIPEEKLSGIAAKLCDRHMSIGADGFMAVEKSDKGDYKMLFFNADGSAGEMCGNGARCICRYGFENGLAGNTQEIETTAGTVTGYRLSGRMFKIRLNNPSVVKLDLVLEADGKRVAADYVELGDPGIPHAAVRITGLKDKTFEELRSLGKALRYHSAFPKGANVNFYDVESDGSITEKTYERGVEDFTYACGTGSGSVVLCLALKGETDGDNVRLSVPGGELFVTAEIEENGDCGNLWLTGPTNIVCRGEVTDEDLII